MTALTRLWRVVQDADWWTRAGLVVLVGVVLMAILGPWLVPHDPNLQDLTRRLRPPIGFERGDVAYPLGTDQYGRDILSRVIAGARVSVLAAATVILVAGSVGTLLAAVAGYYRGVADIVIMRVTDIALALPFLVFAIAMASALGPGMLNLVIILSLFAWATFARILRTQVLSISEEPFIAAARVSGSSGPRTIVRHIIPNLSSTILVLATLEASVVILTEAGLSFLGLGVPPPTASWGSILGDGRSYPDRWWLTAAPGITLTILVLSLNRVSDFLGQRFRANRLSGERPIEAPAALVDSATAAFVDRVEPAYQAPAVRPGTAHAAMTLEQVSLELANGERSRELVTGFTLAVERGETVGLVGPSGSGKSMLCNAVLGTLPSVARMTSGRVTVDGVVFSELSPGDQAAFRRRRIGYVVQDPRSAFNPTLPIGIQVAERFSDRPHFDRAWLKREITPLLAQLNIRHADEAIFQYPYQLSGGMLQRVAIAVALTGKPAVLLADEPTTNLDLTTQAQVVALILGLQRKLGFGALWISHDLQLLRSFCDRVITLSGSPLPVADVATMQQVG
jgi:peptide/nickel transport system permease protein